jgi:uncharacterized protein YigA (DUF484 family)
MATAGPARETDFDSALKARILADPGLVLDDIDVMRRLVEAGDGALTGQNVIDLRAMAMERLETRLIRLEETHQAVITAAYDNMASVQLVQRAVLRLLEEVALEEFLAALEGDVTRILRLVSIRVVLEVPQDGEGPVPRRAGAALALAEPGAVAAALEGHGGREAVLRDRVADRELHGARGVAVRSEALVRLDLGPGRAPGLLVMGSADPEQFRPGQATDLLAFFAASLGRMLRRWLP